MLECSSSEFPTGVRGILRGESLVHTHWHVLEGKIFEQFVSSELPSATPRKTCCYVCNIYFPTGVPGKLRGKSLVHAQWHVLECLSSEYIFFYWCPGEAPRKKLSTYTVACTGVFEL